MPELIEVEIYRRALDRLVGDSIEQAVLHDPLFVRPRGLDAGDVAQLAGFRIAATARRGKLLLVDLERDLDHGGEERTVGLRFGMTGRLVVDGVSAIEQLEYASTRDEPTWDRVVVTTSSSWFAIRDQRRLGSIDLDPDPHSLGPDALAVDAAMLGSMVEGRTTSIKALLLNQSVIAGLGNLLVDEVLFAAGVDPTREAGGLSPEEVERVARAIAATAAELSRRGGSHTGDLFPHRMAGAACPLDGEPLRNDRVGGRGTWWCPRHQR
mgnify:CR=1 FL=1